MALLATADGAVLWGSLAAVGCAAIWAFTVLLYKPAIQRYGPGAPNLFKCTLGAALYCVTLLVTTGGDPLAAFAPATASALLLLMLSGVLGLTVSDTALFESFRHIGSQHSMLIQSTSPVFTATLAFLWAGETLSLRQVLAIGATMAGVTLVVLEGNASPLPGARPLRGYLAALIAALTQALGILAQKPARAVLGDSAVCLVRTATAAAVLAAIHPWIGTLTGTAALVRDRVMVVRIAWAALLGTWLGLLLLSYAIGNAPAGIVGALSSTTPVFLIPLSFLLERQRHGARAIAGTLIAVAGVIVLLA